MNSPALTLVNPQNGNLAFKLFSFEDNNHFDHIQRLNYYSILLIQGGHGTVRADFSEYIFSENNLLAFSPYQPFMLKTVGGLKGQVLHFHPDFFCIHKHEKEVACNGVLFNAIYDPPLLSLQASEVGSLSSILEQMWVEMQKPELAQYELLVSLLKIFLIHASRIKKAIQPASDLQILAQPFILQQLKDAIEEHYETKHSPSEYSTLLNISPKALAKITKSHFNKTLTHLISDRIVIEAKRELYLTSKSVKEIAWQLGFDDEYYFSRLFRNNAEVSPQLFRETVGFARGEA